VGTLPKADESIDDVENRQGEPTEHSEVRVRAHLGRALTRAEVSSFGRVLGSSASMRRLFPLCERLAGSDVPVIIEGETGTGKEVLARSLHEASGRHHGPFVVFDCTTVPPNLVESALFGHEKGAFTGATVSHVGVFEQAHGGTLFLDEIGDLDFPLQAKLLRAIERAEVQRVGGTGWAHVDVRILCATRRDLMREIHAGRFRDDLYYRLAVSRIALPPVREREGDIDLLLEHFWSELSGAPDGLTRVLREKFAAYGWPGNVRELRNAVAHLTALGDLADFDAIRRARRPAADRSGLEVDPSPDVIDNVLDQSLPYMKARDIVLAEFDRRYCDAVLRKHGGNVTKASAASGIARRYFYVIRSRSTKG